MVSSRKEEALWVLALVSHQKTDGLDGMLASVHIVSQEQVVLSVLVWKAHCLERPYQVKELAVNVSKHKARAADSDEALFFL